MQRDHSPSTQSSSKSNVYIALDFDGTIFPANFNLLEALRSTQLPVMGFTNYNLQESLKTSLRRFNLRYEGEEILLKRYGLNMLGVVTSSTPYVHLSEHAATDKEVKLSEQLGGYYNKAIKPYERALRSKVTAAGALATEQIFPWSEADYVNAFKGTCSNDVRKKDHTLITTHMKSHYPEIAQDKTTYPEDALVKEKDKFPMLCFVAEKLPEDSVILVLDDKPGVIRMVEELNQNDYFQAKNIKAYPYQVRPRHDSTEKYLQFFNDYENYTAYKPAQTETKEQEAVSDSSVESEKTNKIAVVDVKLACEGLFTFLKSQNYTGIQVVVEEDNNRNTQLLAQWKENLGDEVTITYNDQNNQLENNREIDPLLLGIENFANVVGGYVKTSQHPVCVHAYSGNRNFLSLVDSYFPGDNNTRPVLTLNQSLISTINAVMDKQSRGFLNRFHPSKIKIRANTYRNLLLGVKDQVGSYKILYALFTSTHKDDVPLQQSLLTLFGFKGNKAISNAQTFFKGQIRNFDSECDLTEDFQIIQSKVGEKDKGKGKGKTKVATLSST